MSRVFTPKIITANALLEGDVIYLGHGGQWVRCLRDARLINDAAQAEAQLAEALADPLVVGAYLADAAPGPDGPRSTHFRETFRAAGPSNYPHGKQVEITADV